MSKVQSYIAIDLDDVLIDTGRLRRGRGSLVRQLSRTPAELRAGKGEAIPDPFNIEIFASRLFPKDGVRAYALSRALNQMLKQSKKYIYPGVSSFLQTLSRNHILILLTYGDLGLQGKKVKYGGLAKYFFKLIITQDHSKKKPLTQLKNKYGKQLIFLDNSLSACRLAKRMGIKAIRLRNSHKDAKYYQSILKRINYLA